MLDQPGLEPMDALEMDAAPGGALYVVGMLTESKDLGVYRVGLDGAVDAWAVLPGMEASDIAVGPGGDVYLLALATGPFNRALASREPLEEAFAEPVIHRLDAAGEVVQTLLVREFAFDTHAEVGAGLDTFYEERLTVAPDGVLYLYSRLGGEVVRIDPETGRALGTMHLTWTGFPAQVRVAGFQFVDRRQLVYTLVEMDQHGLVSGSQSWLIDLEGSGRRMIHRSDAAKQGALWQVHFDPVRRRVQLLDILGPGRGGLRDLDSQDFEDHKIRIH